LSTTARRNDSPVIRKPDHNCYSDHMKTAAKLLICLFLSTPVTAGDMAGAWEAFDGGDYGKARQLWQVLAKDGNAEAMVALAGMAENGAGQTPDLTLARRYYRAAAVLNNSDGMQNLAVMLECGSGGQQDLVAARNWYTKAASAGKAWAARQLERFSNRTIVVTNICRE
jgi:TPR repeat protein